MSAQIGADDQRLLEIEQRADQARSYAASVAEAAFRGDIKLTQRHLAELNIAASEAMKIGYRLGKPSMRHGEEA